jgi:hydrogenase maturation factor
MNRIQHFPTGKIPQDILKRLVFGRLGVSNDRIIQGPHIGEDAAIIEMNDRVLVVATDPITGATSNIGWLVVHINANDVASTGARPIWFLCVTLLPENSKEDLLDEIMIQIHEACTEVGVSLIGGHTETTPGLDRPILIGFMMGETSKNNYVTTGGARPGDEIILTKGAGIEGTSVLANDLNGILNNKIEKSLLQAAKNMIKKISVVPEAMKAIEIGNVNSLHDPTEGGLINGIWEMAEASNVGVEIYETKIPVADETRVVCETLEVDPLKLMGSGALLIVVKRGYAENLISSLSEIGINASIIGSIKKLEKGRYLKKQDGRRQEISAVDQDEVYRILEKYG